jgi:hypothetical protein
MGMPGDSPRGTGRFLTAEIWENLLNNGGNGRVPAAAGTMIRAAISVRQK